MGLDRHFPPNPEYGRGSYRRRVRLANAVGRALASVLDDYHDMRCVVEHDGTQVTGVVGDIARAPFTTCPSASTALHELVGSPLAIGRVQLYGEGRPGRNCTHLFDIAALAMAFALLPLGERVFDLVVPDEVEGGSLIEALVDGKIVHLWRVAGETILTPREFEGRGLFGGFAAWAAATFKDVELDAALALQKAMFVARGRRYLVDGQGGDSLRQQPERIGACFTFSEPQFSIARSIPGYTRDFTDGLMG